MTQGIKTFRSKRIPFEFYLRTLFIQSLFQRFHSLLGDGAGKMIHRHIRHQIFDQIHRALLRLLVPEIDGDLAVNLRERLKGRELCDRVFLALAQHHNRADGQRFIVANL